MANKLVLIQIYWTNKQNLQEFKSSFQELQLHLLSFCQLRLLNKVLPVRLLRQMTTHCHPISTKYIIQPPTTSPPLKQSIHSTCTRPMSSYLIISRQFRNDIFILCPLFLIGIFLKHLHKDIPSYGSLYASRRNANATRVLD